MIGNAGMYRMPPLTAWGCLPWLHLIWVQEWGFFQRTFLREMTRENDWECPNCGNVNFSFSTVCNMRKRNTPKPGSQGAKTDKYSKQKMPDGSWRCEKCDNINYPFRTKCNRPNCGADKPFEGNNSPSSPAGDGNDQ